MELQKLTGYGKAAEKDITEFEGFLGFGLPADYREFLKNFNGSNFRQYAGKPVDEHPEVHVPALKDDVLINVFWGLNLEEPLNLKEWNAEYKSELLPQSLIIGIDIGGIIVLLSGDSENKGVYVWDHAHDFSQSSAESNTYKIAGSFTEFIGKLKLQE
jgi:hypothetical protein